MHDKKKACLVGIASIVFLICITTQTAYAEQPISSKRYKDYQIDRYFGGTIKHTLDMPPYVYHNGQWVDRVIANNGTHFNVYSEMGSFSFNKSSCTITQYAKGFNPITSSAHGDDIIIKDWFWTVARKAGANPWSVIDATMFDCDIDTFSNATGKYLTMVRNHPATGSYLKVTLAAPKDQPVEDFAEFYMNVPSWVGNKFAFALWAKDVKADSIVLRNGTTLNIPQGQTVIDRSSLSVQSLNFMKDGNAFFLDWMKAKDQFKTLAINRTGLVTDMQFGFNNNAGIMSLGQKIYLDPVYGWVNASPYNVETGAGAGAACPAASVKNAALYGQFLADSGAASICIVSAFKYDLTTIPNTAQITNVKERVKTTGSALTQRNCDVRPVTTDPATASAAALWTDIHDGTAYITNDAFCAHNDNIFYEIDLGTAADTAVDNALTTTDWFATGHHLNNEVRAAGTTYQNLYADIEIEITYAVIIGPSRVNTLTATPADNLIIDLDWTAPSSGNGTIQGYRINYTTPFGAPTTILVNNTNSTVTDYSVSGLVEGSGYSFRVAPWTIYGTNATGNIANATAVTFVPANFTIGFINLNATNPDVTPIRFERTDNNATTTTLKVIYDEDYDMACEFDFQFEQTTRTYTTLTPTIYDTDHNSTDFVFLDREDELIKARCWDQTSNATGRYIITQSAFPLLDQIQNFRNGTYGTEGIFGVFDLITLAVVIISMIGFNRINESVGGVINVSLLGALYYFDIIELPTIIFGAIAVVLLLIIGSTRKD